MKIFDKPVIMITHTDLDGVGSPIVLRNLTKFTGDDITQIYYVNNGNVEVAIEGIMEKYGKEGYKLFICDHSPELHMYEKMVEAGMDFMIFDHHKSSEVQGMDNVVFNIKRCGTALFYDYLSALWIQWHEAIGLDMPTAEKMFEDLKQFVIHVNDYDMWIHESPHSKRLNELLYETSIPDFVKRFCENPSPEFTDTEEMIVSSAEKKRGKYIDKAEKTVIVHTDHEKNKYGVVFAEQHQSELGHELNQRLDIDYVIMVNAQASKVSLRSEGKVDVSEIAKHFASMMGTQGGGHKAAAGFGFEIRELPKLYHLLETY